MSNLSIAQYFPFERVCIVGQEVSRDCTTARIQVIPDKRFCPICHVCKKPCQKIHGEENRTLRDLDFGLARVFLECRYGTLFCPRCQAIRIEDLEIFDSYQRITRRLAFYIHQLCKLMTVKEAAKHLGLDWKTVKEADQLFLEAEFGVPNFQGLQILAVDEIALRRGHRYLTIVLDYLTGRIVWIGKHRQAKTLKGFFNLLSKGQKNALQAIVMDMWDPYIQAVQTKVPHVKIVFDLFHVVASFSRVIDRVRNRDYRKASKEHKAVYKGARYLLLKNRSNLRRKKDRRQLKELLALNKTINAMLILKDKLKHLWTYFSRTWAQRALDQWCALARAIGHPEMNRFAKMLERYAYGILNHCDHHISSGKLEGVNNKIKVLKRKAYGYHDLRYFSLKIMQAFIN